MFFLRSHVLKVCIHLKNIRGKSKQKHSSNKYAKNMENSSQKWTKNASKIIQKHAQKTQRKTRHPLSTKSAPRGDQNTADKGGKGRDPGWNPPRKKKNTAKTRLTAGKGACRKETRRHSQSQHAPRRTASGPGANFLMHFGRPLAHFWLPFGSRWLTFGSRWLTFGSLWLTFGSLWHPFGSILLPFGSLFVPLGSLLVPLALDSLIFDVS